MRVAIICQKCKQTLSSGIVNDEKGFMALIKPHENHKMVIMKYSKRGQDIEIEMPKELVTRKFRINSQLISCKCDEPIIPRWGLFCLSCRGLLPRKLWYTPGFKWRY